MATPILIKEQISHLDCKAIAGIGYTFRMKVFYKNEPTDSWHEGNESKSISVGYTCHYDLSTIEGIKLPVNPEILTDYPQVRLGLNVSAGPDREANEAFVYRPDTGKRAYYEATGPCTNAALRYIDVRDN